MNVFELHGVEITREPSARIGKFLPVQTSRAYAMMRILNPARAKLLTRASP